MSYDMWQTTNANRDNARSQSKAVNEETMAVRKSRSVQSNQSAPTKSGRNKARETTQIFDGLIVQLA
eukprot:scaffold223140_cov34-Prasinocladus_malaysianus.AAC.1